MTNIKETVEIVTLCILYPLALIAKCICISCKILKVDRKLPCGHTEREHANQEVYCTNPYL